MMAGDCTEMQLLVQAEIDGELAPADAARVAAHMAGCVACAALHAQLRGLSDQVRLSAPYYQPSTALLAKVRSQSAAPPASAVEAARPRRFRGASWASFGAGFALAACLALGVLLPLRDGDMAEMVVADHIRALQPGHLMDVPSTDQHTVKPWFDGRIDYAPPVKDLKGGGFPLTGGRLDYLAGRPVAALVYQSRQHVIDLYVWPQKSLTGLQAEGSRGGYNFQRWSRGGMVFWAVSDVNAQDLAQFARLWQAD